MGQILLHHVEIKNITGADYNLFKDKWCILRLYTFTGGGPFIEKARLTGEIVVLSDYRVFCLAVLK